MKAEVNINALRAAVKNVQRAVAKTALPVLDNLLVEAGRDGEKGFLRLSATDLGTTISQVVEAAVPKTGNTTVPAVTFGELLASLDGESVALSLGKGEVLTVKADGSRSRIKGIPTAEYPPLPAVNGTESVTVSADTLARAVKLVAFSAAKKEDRSPLHGVQFHVDNGKLRLTAVDGYRLSIVTLPVDGSGNFAITIPAKAAVNLQRIISGCGDVPVSVAAEQERIAFECLDKRLVSQAIEGKYPDVLSLIPESRNTRITLDLLPLETAVKQASLFGDAVRFDAEGESVAVSGKSQEAGETKTTLKGVVEGEKATFALDSTFVKDVLKEAKGADAAEVFLDVVASDKPVVLRFRGLNDYQHVIMPMRLD